MSISESGKLVTPCHFRADGVFCVNGLLYYSRVQQEPTPALAARVAELQQKEIDEGRLPADVVYYKPVQLEGEPVTCSACEGRGVILTDLGKELLLFFDTFLRPRVRDVITDYIDEKTGL